MADSMCFHEKHEVENFRQDRFWNGFDLAGNAVGQHAHVWNPTRLMADRKVAHLKELKQRFSRWHNRRVGRKGPVWEDRHKSVQVEDSETALRTIAAYIDLNPVCAGLVTDPKDYRWGGLMAMQDLRG